MICTLVRIREKKAFAGFLLDDRKEKKRVLQRFYNLNNRLNSTKGIQTKPLYWGKKTKPVELLKRKGTEEKINATDELLHLILWPTGIDRSPPCIRMPPPLVASFCFAKFFYLSLSICSTKNRSWGHQSFSCEVYLFAACIYASSHGATHCPPLCRLLRAQTKFSRWTILVLRRDNPCTMRGVFWINSA